MTCSAAQALLLESPVRARRNILRCAFGLSLAIAPALPGLAQDAIPDVHTDPRFRAEVELARSPGQIPQTAIMHWENANRIAGRQCAECLEHIATLSFRIGRWQPAADAAESLAAVAPKSTDKAYAELLRGSALLRLNDDRPTLLDLDHADSSFKAAFAHDPTLRTALYLDGRALAALHRDTEARAVFLHYAELVPSTDRYRARALRFADNLVLARATMAPPLSVTTADGQTLSLDTLHGRVVLLDFWATWCVPCRELLPRLQHLSQRFHDQPFTLISISWDDDQAAWHDYIAQNHMTWPQVLDTDHTLSASYGVDALPHYFTVDPDGVLQSEVVGLGNDDLEARIADLLEKAKALPPAGAGPKSPPAVFP